MIDDQYINARFERIEAMMAQMSQNIEILREVIEYMGEGSINEILKEARGELPKQENEEDEGDEDQEEEKEMEEAKDEPKRSKPKRIED